MKKIWKKICSVCLMTGVVLTLSACGSKQEQQETTTVVEESVQQTEVQEESTETDDTGLPGAVYSLVNLYAENGGKEVSGSGFLAKEENGKLYICTNRHVIESADTWTVTFADGTQAIGRKEGCSDVFDVGVVSVHSEDVDAETAGKLAPVNVDIESWLAMSDGEKACGNIKVYRMSREGYTGTCVEGTVAGLMEEFAYGNGLNHTKMNIILESGDSGSAVFDEDGNLLAMVVGEVYETEGSPSRWGVPLASLLTSYQEVTGKEWVPLF